MLLWVRWCNDAPAAAAEEKERVCVVRRVRMDERGTGNERHAV